MFLMFFVFMILIPVLSGILSSLLLGFTIFEVEYYFINIPICVLCSTIYFLSETYEVFND